ncbi:cell division protein ZapE [Nocardia lijiangensis]|uniref:cell division protein ZapE n=1 Tax=Nocardia lijiangensis TaxID=299618 RepID=UPI00082DC926|nr:cell division protein ZapE [Nocardia lijiangensis]
MTIELDPDQRAAADRLERLVDRRGRPIKGARGVYLHGRPGRGKTMLMDRFLATVDADRVKRYHFHWFFAELHSAAHETGSIDIAIERLLGSARLVCFDEFHVHDIGDAMLIARMLDALFARRIALVLTSNYPPEQLLPNPLFHDRFLPTIARIVEHLDVISVDGPTDYRALRTRVASGFTAGRYLIGGTPTASMVEVPIGDRTLRARTVDGDAITIDFAALCGAATSAADYVRLAQRFRRWTIEDVPRLREVPPDWAMRLVNLVDVLYDADLELTLCAAAPLPELIDGVVGVPDISRTASRLCEISQPVSAAAG